VLTARPTMEHWNNSTRDSAGHIQAHVPAAYCVRTSGESGLPVRVGAVGRSRIRLFAVSRPRKLERCRCNSPTTSSRSVNRQSATETTGHPVVCNRHLASHCGLVSTSHASPFVRIRPTTAVPEFSTTFQRCRISVTNGNRVELTMPQHLLNAPALLNAARMLPNGSRNLAR